jgi:hypothetical protein
MENLKMLIKFERSKIEFRKVKLKSVNASNGYVLLEDGKRLECTSNLVTTIYKNVYGMTSFAIPAEFCLMMYDGLVVALEKAVFNNRYNITSNGDMVEWQPLMISKLEKIMMKIHPDYNYYFDGSYVYTFAYHDVLSKLRYGRKMTDDGKFVSIDVSAVNISNIMSDWVHFSRRNCLGYIASNGDYAVTSPLWATLVNIGENNMKKATMEIKGGITQFDKVDRNMIVSLQFAIYSGKLLSKVFGYHSIDFLQLPKLMIQLNTVNLPNVPVDIRNTFDIGIPFTQCMAHLLGLLRKCETLEDVCMMNKVIKNLSTKGIYSRKAISATHNIKELPLLVIE